MRYQSGGLIDADSKIKQLKRSLLEKKVKLEPHRWQQVWPQVEVRRSCSAVYGVVEYLYAMKVQVQWQKSARESIHLNEQTTCVTTVLYY